MKRFALILFLALWQTPLTAQENCPVLLASGQWDAWMAGTATAHVNAQNFRDFVQAQPAAGRGTAQIDASACDGTFTLQMPQFAFNMAAVDEDRQEYEGTTTYRGMNWKVRLRRLSATQMAGGFEAKMSAGGVSTTVRATGLGLESQENMANQRPECLCRTQLEEFINTRIQNQEKYLRAFENELYRERPASWSADPSPYYRMWQINTYKRLIDLIVLDVPYQQAVDRIWENTDGLGRQDSQDDLTPELMEAASSASSSGSSSGGNATGSAAAGYTTYTVVAAWVDEQCKLHKGTEHLTTCFPDIALEGTLTHEKIHVGACTPGQPNKNIIDFAEAEENGYEAEIEWLNDWIPDNCGG